MTLVLTLKMTEKEYKNGIERVLRSIRDNSTIFGESSNMYFNGHDGRVDFTYDPDRRLYFAHDKDGAELLQGPARAARAFIDKMQAPTPDQGGDPGDLLVDVVYGGDDTEETVAPKEVPPDEKAAIISGVMAALEGQPGDPANWGSLIADQDYWGGGGMTPNLF